MQFIRLFIFLFIVALFYLSAEPTAAADSFLQWPVTFSDPWNQLSSPFGPRLQASQNQRYDFHRGIDIVSPDPNNQSVVAAATGFVFRIYPEGSSAYPEGGNVLVLQHDLTESIRFHGHDITRYYTLYFHLKNFAQNLNIGDTIQVGQNIGEIGSSGTTEFEHLHFEIRLGTTCSFEYQLTNPLADCSQFGFDPHVNPLTYLPHPPVSNIQLHVTFDHASIIVQFSLPRNAAVFNSLQIIGLDSANQPIKKKILNLNKRVGLDPSSTTTLDNNTYDDLTIQPKKFSSTSKRLRYTVIVQNFINSDLRKMKVQLKDVQHKKLKHTLIDL